MSSLARSNHPSERTALLRLVGRPGKRLTGGGLEERSLTVSN